MLLALSSVSGPIFAPGSPVIQMGASVVPLMFVVYVAAG